MNNSEEIMLNRKFGYVVAGALLCIALLQFVFRRKYDVIIVVIALILLFLALVKPNWLTPPRTVWDKLGHVLGIINTHVLLTLFYCLILSPLGLLMRLFGKDILKLKKSACQPSYWETTPNAEESKMENQF